MTKPSQIVRRTVACALTAVMTLGTVPAQALAEAVEEVGIVEVTDESSDQDGATLDVQAEEPAIEGLTPEEEPLSVEEPTSEAPVTEVPAEGVPAAEEPSIEPADDLGVEESANPAANNAGQMTGDSLELDAQGSNDVIVTFSYDANHDESYRLLGLVNQARAQVGCAGLVWDADLENYALLRAAELVLHYSHTRPNGDKYSSGIPGWTTGAVRENIHAASWEMGASECNTAWTNSADHYENMIATDVGSFGAAIIYCQGMTYAVEVFRGGTSSKQYRANYGSRVSHPIHSWSTWVSRQNYSMSVNPTSMTLTPGQSQSASLYVGRGNADWPSNAINWSSSNTSVATVATGTGALTVTGKNPGTATITGTHSAIGYSVYINVTVRNIEPTSVSLNRSSLSLYPGDGASLTGTVYPTNAANKTLTWSSTNTSVATVSSSGYVTAGTPGSATITARTTNGKTATCYVTVNRRNISGATVNAVNDAAYTGSAIRPEPKVTLNGKVLTKGTDFSYSYKNNTSVGTATVTVTGMGNYTGSISRNFEIYLTKDVPVSVVWNDANDYHGTRPTFVRVMFDSEGKNSRGETFGTSGNYSVSSKDGWRQTFKGVRTPSEDGTGLTFVVEAGSVADYTSDVKGSFAKGYTVTYTTTKKIDISGGYGMGVTSKTYTGKAQTQSPSVSINGVMLKSGTDYTVSYQNNVNAGLASVICTGKGIFTNAKTIYFNIVPAQISSATVTKLANQTYTGKALTPKPTLTFNGATLKEGTDYTLSYANNTNVGTAMLTITGTGNFQGTVTQTFSIAQKSIASASLGAIADQTYTGAALKPSVVVKDGAKTLKQGTDYTVAYKNNVNAGTATITVTGKGNYAGTKTTSFKVVAKHVTPRVQLSPSKFTYNAKAQKPTRVTVWDGDTQLVEGTDYTLGQYPDSVDAGSYEVTVTLKGNRAGSATATYAIASADVSGATIDVEDVTYNGKAQMPEVTVTYGGRVLAEGVDYSLSYEDNVNAGAGVVEVMGLGNYTGYRTSRFSIAPKTVALPKTYARTYNGSAQVGVASSSLYVRSGTYKATKAGSYTATVTLKDANNYEWADGTSEPRRANWSIAKLSIANSKVKVASVGTQAWTGKALTPAPTLTFGTATLKKGTDYALSYKNNTKAGTATVTIAGKGNYAGTRSATFKIVRPSVQYYVHRQTYGWEDEYSKADGQQSGTTGQSKRLEGICVRLASKPVTGSIQYRTHIQTYGWETSWRKDGAMSGTTGESKRLEAIQIKLTGEMAKRYDVYYRVHAQHFGWMGWAKNGASAGTAGYSYRLEAIQIVLVPKGGSAPAATYQGATRTTAEAFVQK